MLYWYVSLGAAVSLLVALSDVGAGRCSLCSTPTSAIRWMASIASVLTLPSSRRSDCLCHCVRVVREPGCERRQCTSARD